MENNARERTEDDMGETEKRNIDRLLEMVVYVASESRGDERFALTKLYKILFFADFDYFAKHGRSITGADYVSLPYGPAPAQMKRAIKELKASGRLTVVPVMFHGKNQKVPVSQVDADLSQFSGDEVATMARAIKSFWNKSATDLSLLSHQFPGWIIADNGREIPYSLALVGPARKTLHKVRKAKGLDSVAEKYVD